MLSSLGVVKVDPRKGRIVVDVSRDFIEYYNWFITKTYWTKLNLPLHSAHITIANKKLHTGVDWELAKIHHNKIVEFQYDENLVRGGYTKGFIMFYAKVFSESIDKIKESLTIIEKPTYKGLHITIGSIGKNGNAVIPYWPEIIKI